uniref:V-type proton ATPase subunit D n=1 Tax=Glossina brevipalpis TaxID=37001 RepID=A0A1A9WUY6_9MUSC
MHSMYAILMKQRTVSATKGLSLLKRKRDALELHLREMSAELIKNREHLDTTMREAIFSLTKANFLNTDFKPATIIKPDRADAYVRIKENKIIGMSVPKLDLVIRTTAAAIPFTGLSTGGRQVEETRLKFQEALKVLVAVASLEYNVKILTEAVRTNNMRVNGLDYVVIPRFQNTANYIRDELDELEREDFYRLKRSQAKQIKKKEELKKLAKIDEEPEEEIVKPEAVKLKPKPEVKIMDYGESRAATTRSVIHSLGPQAMPASRLSRYVSFIKDRNTIVLESGEVPPVTELDEESTVPQDESEETIQKRLITSSSDSSADTFAPSDDQSEPEK